jgi:hypothetical protein
MGEGSQELGFAGVRCPHHGHLAGPFALDAEEVAPASPFFALLLILELGEPPAQIGPQLIGALVVGHDGEHGLEGSGLFRRCLGLSKPLFCVKILGWQVGWHMISLKPLSALPIRPNT